MGKTGLLLGRNNDSANSRHKGRGLTSGRADADGARLSRQPRIADINLVTAAGETLARTCAQCDVVTVGANIQERIHSNRAVAVLSAPRGL